MTSTSLDHRVLELTRKDGSAVVYLAPVGFGALELHELALRDGHWSQLNLSTLAGAPVSADGSVVGYVRADGVGAIVYRGVDRHLHELALFGATWRHTDLTAAAGAPTGPALAGTGSIATLAGPDGVTVVAFVSMDGRVCQLSRGVDGRWTSRALTGDLDPKAHGLGLAAYARPDGVVALAYRSRNQRIYEVTPQTLHDLTARAGGVRARGQLAADRRADGTVTVVYEGTDFRRHELAQRDGTWSHTDLGQDRVEVGVEAGLMFDDPVGQPLRPLAVGRLS